MLKSVSKDEASVKPSSTVDITSNTYNTDTEKSRRLGNILAALNTAGSMSTFAAGYLFYNIITYDSDVLRLPDNEVIGMYMSVTIISSFSERRQFYVQIGEFAAT